MGRSGGLWLLWQDDIDAEIISFSKNLIHLQVNQNGAFRRWNLFCVYGPPNRQERGEFWHSLSIYAQQVDGPKCFIGNFNAISSVREKFGGDQSLNGTITPFNNFTRDNHLLDLGFSGPAFTGTNGRQMQPLIRQRLDRVVASPDWCLMFENSGVLHLPRLSSDHSPIILNMCRSIPRNPPSYKFEAYWCNHPDFLKVVLESWNINISGDLMDAADNISITSVPSTDTIWKVVKNMNPFGSPGPDGFPVIFYKKSWSAVGDDIVKFIQEIFT
ncbi:uncharacterized protein LOC113352505 [Papaver somniferum]|uniref:uncharacterized protein LOC113352505 n=1 Tax=Papaver somniferum TaxID=3469 RepID=UPI000E6FA626|nr:uncharacterized protein LOC113352505 [Papaver somniferum]